MTNLLDYREGASYMSVPREWTDLVCSGSGKSFGVELLLRKQIGVLTGWIGYTWSKSLRCFDRSGQIINGGKEFYSRNDCRNNFNIVINQKLGKHWEANASWIYYTGRRGNIANIIIYGGLPNEFDPASQLLSSSHVIAGGAGGWDSSASGTRLQRFMQLLTFKERNNFKFAANHHLDISINYRTTLNMQHLMIGLSVYNVYNRMNVSEAFLAFDEFGTPELKCITRFPFMPSLNFQVRF